MTFNVDSGGRLPDPRFRGMNPDFVKKVWEKRRKLETKRKLAERKRRVREIKPLPMPELSPKARMKAVDIIRWHADCSEFSYEDIIGQSRMRPLVAVRQAAIADVYVRCPHLSLPQIGKMFGGRDHTTCLHAVVKLGVHQPKRHASQAA